MFTEIKSLTLHKTFSTTVFNKLIQKLILTKNIQGFVFVFYFWVFENTKWLIFRVLFKRDYTILESIDITLYHSLVEFSVKVDFANCVVVS